MDWQALLPLVGVGIVALLAGTLSGVIGTGSSMLLMPVLVLAFGPQQAVPVMAIAAVLGNLGRALAWWHSVDWRACAVYAASAIPAAAVGVRTLLVLPAGLVEALLGLFFLAMIPARRRLARRQARLSLWQLALIGVPVGFLTAIVVSTGPLSVPLFVMYGLERGALLATEAASSLAIYGTKVAAFQAFSALSLATALRGLVVGAALMAGSFVARGIVRRMPPAHFSGLIDGLMAVSGLSLLWAACR